MDFNFDELKKKWPAPIVARTEVSRFSGGLLNPRTMANQDSLGVGPRHMKMGKKVFYTVDDLVNFMKKRTGAGE